MARLILEVPLSKYLRDITQDWGTREEIFITKSFGEQLWISVEAPGVLYRTIGVNYIEFNEAGAYSRLPKEINKLIDLDKGETITLDILLKEIAKKERRKG